MKKILLLLFALLSTVGIHADVLAKLTFPGSNDKGANGYTEDWTATNEYGTWAISHFNNYNNAASWTYIKCGWKSEATTATITTPVINDAITNLTVTVDKTSEVNKATVEVIKNGTTISTVNCTKDWTQGEVVINVSAEKGCSLKLILENAKTKSNGTTQISKIAVNGTHEPAGDPVAVESVTLTNDKGEALGMYQALTVTETMKIIAQVSPSDATNKTVSWEVMQESEVISFENGVVKALAPGRAALVATTEDGEYQAAVTFVVSPIQDATIADFIAAKGKTCYLTGVVGEIKNTTYGNFNLTDESGTIYVYGCLTPDGEKQKFAELGVEEGNKITVLASSYLLYKEETDEAVDVVFVENHGTPAAPKTYTFEVAVGSDEYVVIPSDEEVQYWATILPAEYEGETLTADFVTGYIDEILDEMGEGLDYFTGEDGEPIDWYADESGKYLVVVCAVDENYKRVSDVTIVPFTAAVMSVSEAGYATFVAPFQVTIPEAVKAYTVDAVDGTALTLTEVSTIAANTPVVLEGELDETLVSGEPVQGNPVAGLLTGVYEETEAPVGSYVLQNHAAGVGFYKVGSELPTVEPNHAYLTVDSDVKVFGLAQATAIKALTAGKAEIYDVNGRQIQKLQKGINIVNGVKVLVK